MDWKQTSLRLPSELLEQLRQQAQERGDSVNETIIRYIRQGLEGEFRRSGSRTGEQRSS